MNQYADFVLATEHDAKTIVELRQKIWSTTYRGIYPNEMIDQFDYVLHTEKELQRIHDSNYLEYLIIKDERYIGYMIIHTKDVLFLQSLYILAEYQHQGIGTAAFLLVKKHCTENGFASFSCQCVPENQNARNFYARMGGKVIAEDLENEEHWQNSVVYQFDVNG